MPHNEDHKKIPAPDEIQKEFEDFVKERFGGQVQVVSHAMPGPQATEATSELADDTSAQQPEIDIEKLKFDYRPRDLKQHLDRYVIGQDEAKKALAIAVCDHYNHVLKSARAQADAEEGQESKEYAKQNVMVLGPTGVGKTYLVKHIAKLIGVPFVKVDATRFSETGFVGANVDDLVRDLVSQAQGNISLAQFGIIYLDEADKLAGSETSGSKDVSGRGVQFGLLKLMEETEVDLSSGNDMRSQMQAFMELQTKGKVTPKIVNTKNILFIVSGAFSGLGDIIKQRLNQGGIGFGASSERKDRDTDFLPYASTEDFIKFGFEPEFIGRLPVRVACHRLVKDDLKKVLTASEGSVLHQYRGSFGAYGIDVDFKDDAIDKVAEEAYSQRTGARALMTILEKALRDFKFELPSTGVTNFSVTAETIENPKEQLAQILKEDVQGLPEEFLQIVRQFEDNFSSKHGLSISFSRQAEKKLYEIRTEDFAQQLESMFAGYEYGLKLIHQNTGNKTFEIGHDTVKEPKAALERWIRDSYNTDGDRKQ